jgi:hypothetical protein
MDTEDRHSNEERNATRTANDIFLPIVFVQSDQDEGDAVAQGEHHEHRESRRLHDHFSLPLVGSAPVDGADVTLRTGQEEIEESDDDDKYLADERVAPGMADPYRYYHD